MIKYRGIRTALAIGVCEGDGADIPYQIVEYIVEQKNNDTWITVGKVVPLSEEERSFIGSDLM